MTNKEIVKQRLQELADENGGYLTAARVVEDAKSPDSPLHRFFDWDMVVAAEKYWVITARKLMNCVNVTYKTEKSFVTVKAYIRNPDVPAKMQSMVAVPTLAANREKARAALVEEFKRAVSIMSRANRLAEVLGLQDEIDEIISALTALRVRVAVDGDTEVVHV